MRYAAPAISLMVAAVLCHGGAGHCQAPEPPAEAWLWGLMQMNAGDRQRVETLDLHHVAADEFVWLFHRDPGRRPAHGNAADPPLELPAGIQSIGAYAPLNAVIVVGSGDGISALRELAQKVDVPAVRVTLSFQALAVRRDHLAALAAPEDTPIGKVVASRVATPRLLRELARQGVERLATPRVTTIQGRPAFISSGDGGRLAAHATPALLPDRRVLLRLELESGVTAGREAEWIPKDWTDEVATVLRTAIVLSPKETGVVLGAVARRNGKPELVPTPCPDDPSRCLVWLVEAELQ